MSVIELTGFRADVPIGAMGSFGVLRIASRLFTQARLAWKEASGGWYPALYVDAELREDGLIDALIADVTTRDRKELAWGEGQVKTVNPAEYHKLLLGAGADRQLTEWFAAFGNELAHDGETIKPTPFDMSVARQKFLTDADKLRSALAASKRSNKQKSQREEFREALFGPWKYEDDQHSLGWDPSTVKLGAFTFKAPTLMANTGVRAAVWLAFESLPLFPVFAKGKTQKTRAFIQDGRTTEFYWPVWEPPITIRELASLLSSSALTDDEEWAELQGRGVCAIYRSLKYKPNKYMVTFGVSELVFRGVS